MLVAFLDQMVVRLVEFCAHVPIVAFVRVGQKVFFIDKILKLFYNIDTQNLGATHFECVTRWR